MLENSWFNDIGDQKKTSDKKSPIEEQFHQGLHCLSIHLHLCISNPMVCPLLIEIKIDYNKVF